MKHTESDAFWSDWDRLTPRERGLFIAAVQSINEAFARRGHRPLPRWPAALPVKPIRGIQGVLEMTWSFSGPDGRATFELTDLDGEPAIRWRRIGDHRILREP